MKRVSFIIPTYNEANNLPLLVEEILSIIDKTKIDLEFIIVDDNSPDGTGGVAEELAKKYPLKVIHRLGKLGLGSAVREGFKLSQREILGVMDADLSHDPAILNNLILSLEENDLALGSRFEPGSVVENWAAWRRALSNLGVFFARFLTGVKDPLSGYFFFKREVINGAVLKTRGYKILLEILVKGKINKIKELSYKFRVRKFSASKLNFQEYLLFFGQLIKYTGYKFWRRVQSDHGGVCFVSILLLSLFLLFYKVSARTLWMDETAVLEYLYYTPNPFIFLADYFKVPDNHPPLFYFSVITVYKLLPWQELGIRLVSVLSGLGLVITAYYFSLLLFKNKTTARLTMFLMTVSSYFLLISQMARYHSLSALLALLSLYYFFKIILTGYRRKLFIGFLILAALTGYTDLPHFVYLVAMINLCYFYCFCRRHAPVKLGAWLYGQAALFVSFAPIIYLFYLRVFEQGDGGFEKVSLLGRTFFNWASDFLMHFYAYFFGENILPWNWLPFGLGAAVMLVLTGVLIKIFYKRQSSPGLALLAYSFFAAIILNTIFMNFADPRYNFIVYPKFVFVAFPLFIMLCAYLIMAMDSKFWRGSIFMAFAAVQIYGLFNFYQAKNYLNASYFNDFKGYEFARDNSRPGDYLIINGDLNIGAYNFYKDEYFKNLIPVDLTKATGTVKKGERVWFFSASSDGDSAGGPASAADKIPTGLAAIDKYESVPLDPTLKKVKEKIFRRASYTYKHGVFLLVKE